MTSDLCALRNAFARIEALEARSLLSGEIDHSFGSNGLVELGEFRSTYSATQVDGKIVVAGEAAGGGGTLLVRRYLPGGQPDSTFNGTGRVSVSGVRADRVNAVSVLGDGRVFVQGQTYVRLTASGQPDNTFSGDGRAASILAGDRRTPGFNGVAVLADGSFLELQTANDGRSSIYKYRPDGSVDRTYGRSGAFDVGALAAGGLDLTVDAVAVDAQNRAYVAYQFGRISGDSYGSQLHIARLTPQGKLDASYGTGGVVTSDANSRFFTGQMAVLTDGRVVAEYGIDGPGGGEVAGTRLFVADTAGQSLLAGAYVGDFDSRRLVAGPNGTLFVVGFNYEFNPLEGLNEGYAAVAHLNSDLSLNTRFSPDRDGIAGFRTEQFASANDFAVATNGDLVMVGSSGGNLMTKFTGVSTSTKVTYQLRGDTLTVSGSSGADRMQARTGTGSAEADIEDPYGLVVRLDATDNNGGLYSQDVIAFRADQPAPTNVVFNLYGGDDVFDATRLSQGVFVRGGAGNDRIAGGTGNDTLLGEGGTDTITGGGGTDQIVP